MQSRKLPELEPETAFFWQSGADGQLRVQHCPDCCRYQHPPFPRCTACGSEGIAPRVVSGKGRVASFTINHEAWTPGLAEPFVFAAIELAEQAELYLFSNVIGPVEAVRIGLPVRVVFEQHEDVWLPLFAADEADHG